MAFIIADRVKETTTTTGTGALTLAGTLTGFTTFAARCAVGDTLYYAIQAVDGAGAPTGEWECGLGTYSGTSTLTRTTVTSSSNSDTAVSFAAGTKQVFITMPAVQARWARERLTADRTYYVRTDGSDANTGLANTSGGAFLTIQRALDAITVCDIGIYSVIVQLGDGTYNAPITISGPWLGSGAVTIKGNAATPGNTVITSSGLTVYVKNAGSLYLDSVKVTSTGSFCILASMTGAVYCTNLDFGTCASRQMQADDNGVIRFLTGYTISASSPTHMQAATGGIIRAGAIAVTLVGTPAFSNCYASALQGGALLLSSATFTGSATGKRYNAVTNALIDVGAAATTFLPGNATGTTATGGQYA